MSVTEVEIAGTRQYAERWPRVLSWLFGGRAVSEAVVTRIHFEAAPERIWRGVLFYEDVPGRAPLLLRMFLPCPVRTVGSKSEVGTSVLCIYSVGDLVKRITKVEGPRYIEFEVVEQCLGIEGCVKTLGGSYEIRRRGSGSEVVLTTNYRAFLHPRVLWRPLERLVTNQLHHHVLNGIGLAVQQETKAV